MTEYFAENIKITECKCDICNDIIHIGETFYKRLSDYTYYCCDCFDTKYNNNIDNWEHYKNYEIVDDD